MAKKTKEDINLDEIDENFIIASFKTPGKPQTPVADNNKVEAAEQQEIPKEQMQTEHLHILVAKNSKRPLGRKKSRKREKAKKEAYRSTAKNS